MQALFKADVQSLPAYVGAGDDGSYLLYKIVKVSHPEKIDEKARQGMQREYSALVAQEELAAYLAGLRTRYKININTAALASKERQ